MGGYDFSTDAGGPAERGEVRRPIAAGARRLVGRLARPLCGREQPIWGALGSPRLRYAAFRSVIDTALFSLLRRRQPVHFIQIGSNDGCTNDPLWTFRRYPNWRGILVEPAEPVFRRLEENYAPFGDRFVLLNAAVTSTAGIADLYFPAEQLVGLRGADQLGSLHRGLVLRHLHAVGASTDLLRTIPVRCMTLDEVCRRLPTGSLDVLHIDAEGMDGDILLQVDFDRWQPLLILFEHIHLAPDTLHAVHNALRCGAYRVHAMTGDTLAVLGPAHAAAAETRFVHTLLDRMEATASA